MVASYLSQKVMIKSMRANAEIITNIVHESRRLYSDEVIGRIDTIPEIKVSTRYKDHEFGVPNPATYTIMLGERLSSQNANAKLMISMYSGLPFKNRTNRKLDEFAEQALEHVEKTPVTPYQSITQLNGIDVIRFASPMVMSESCVVCHNAHPESPMKNWSIGDVRGVLEVTQQLQSTTGGLSSAYLTRNLFFIIAAFITFSGLIILIRHYQANARIKREVANQTAFLLEQSLTDELTGLGNRRYFQEKFDEAWRYCIRYKSSLSLAILDVDHFKDYNDEFGHPVGDACLVQISQGIKEGLFRPLDVVARYGGEEFIIVLVDTNINGTEKALNNIRTSISKLSIPNASNVDSKIVTVSIGCVTVTDIKAATPESVIEQADKALYKAKAAGRNTNICLPYKNPE